MVTKVLSRCPFDKRVFFSLKNFPTSVQPSTPKYSIFDLTASLSCQNFSILKSNFWIRRLFSNISKNVIPADIVRPPNTGEFRLQDSFLSKYKDIAPPFGFNGLGEIVYRRTYSRLKADEEKEQWYTIIYFFFILIMNIMNERIYL